MRFAHRYRHRCGRQSREGCYGVGRRVQWIQNIKTTTDAEGKYFIKYFPAQTYGTQISATAKAYSDFSDYATIAEGDTTTLNITMKKCAVVRLSGKVTSATDNATPVLGATIAISGDNDLTTTTDAEGGYSLSGVYAQKNYTIKVTAPGYEVYDYYGGYPVIFDSADDSTATFDINLTRPRLRLIAPKPSMRATRPSLHGRSRSRTLRSPRLLTRWWGSLAVLTICTSATDTPLPN